MAQCVIFKVAHLWHIEMCHLSHWMCKMEHWMCQMAHLCHKSGSALLQQPEGNSVGRHITDHAVAVLGDFTTLPKKITHFKHILV